MSPQAFSTTRMGNSRSAFFSDNWRSRSAANPAAPSVPWRRHSAPSSISTPPPPPPPRALPAQQKPAAPPRRDSAVDLQSENWRAEAAPLKSLCMPSFDDVKLGMVFHLPGSQGVQDSLKPLKLAATNRPWDHPAVVVRKYEENGEEYVHIRTCTTFNHQVVTDVKIECQQNLFLLADNEEDRCPHNDTHLGKMAPGSARFKKRTYVNMSFDSVYPVKYALLELRNGQLPMQFDEDALDMIKRRKPFPAKSF